MNLDAKFWEQYEHYFLLMVKASSSKRENFVLIVDRLERAFFHGVVVELDLVDRVDEKILAKLEHDLSFQVRWKRRLIQVRESLVSNFHSKIDFPKSPYTIDITKIKGGKPYILF